MSFHSWLRAPVRLVLDERGAVAQREVGVIEHLAAGGIDDLVVAPGQRDEPPLLVEAAVILVLNDLGVVAGRGPGVVEYLAAGHVDDQVVAVGQRDETPALIAAAVELVLLDDSPVAGREIGVVEHLAAVDVRDVERRQQLPALESLATCLVLALSRMVHGFPPRRNGARMFPAAAPTAGAAGPGHQGRIPWESTRAVEGRETDHSSRLIEVRLHAFINPLSESFISRATGGPPEGDIKILGAEGTHNPWITWRWNRCGIASCERGGKGRQWTTGRPA